MSDYAEVGLESEQYTLFFATLRSFEEHLLRIPLEWLGPAGRLLREDIAYSATECSANHPGTLRIITGAGVVGSGAVGHQPGLMMDLDFSRNSDH